MALPIISHNSPSAGYISWTAFGMSYGSGNYAIPPGNTNKRYVWWQYNGGAPALKTDDDFNVMLAAMGQDDTVLMLNKTGIGAMVLGSSQVDGDLIVNGSILASAIGANAIQANHIGSQVIQTNHIGANTVQANHIKTNTIGANHIGANVIEANHISSGAVTTDALSVGTVGDSLVSNGAFEEVAANGLPMGWRAVQTTNGTIATVTGVSTSGGNAVRLAATTTAADLKFEQTPEKFIPVTATAGRLWYIAARMGVGTTITRGVYVRAIWYDANKVKLTGTEGSWYTTVISNVGMTGAYDVLEGQCAPPALARYMSIQILLAAPNVVTNLYVDDIVAREVVVSAVIGDGAITSPKIIANAINATHVAAGSITATEMLIAQGANLFTDPLVKDSAGWAGSAYFAATGGKNGGGCITLPQNASQTGLYYGQATNLTNRRTRLVPGGTYRLGGWVKTSTDALTGMVQLYLRCQNPDSTTGILASNVSGQEPFNRPDLTATPGTPAYLGTIPADTWTFVSGMVKVPETTAYTSGVLGVFKQTGYTTGTTIWSDLSIQQAMAGELVVDGTIKTQHMTANTIDANVLLVNTISTNLIKTNAITSNEIAANVVSTIHLGANVVTSNEIGANAIIAKHIGAGAISANKLVVGSAVNGLADPSFATPELLTARLGRSSGGVAGWTVAAPAAGGERSISRVTGTTNDSFHYSPVAPVTGTSGNGIQVTAGQKWVMSVDVETSVSAGVRWNIYRYNADGTVSYIGLSPYNTATGRRPLEHVYTVPAGTIAIDVALACNITGATWTVYGNAIVAMQTPSTLIEDGAITTNTLAANSVNSTKIIANAITATHISANSITAIKIGANALDAKVITGSTVQTAATGARLVLNTTGLNGWDANNVNYLTANSSGLSVTGTLTAEGTGYTGGTPIPVEVVIGGSTARVSNGLTTEQLPPNPPATTGGNPVPGIAFKPTATTMYDFAQLTAVDGRTIKLQSGVTQAVVTANADLYRVTALTLPDDGIYSNKPLFAKYSAAHQTSKRVPLGVLAVVKLPGQTTVTTTETQFGTSTITVLPGSILEISGSFAGYPNADNLFMSWHWKANGVRFTENSHKADIAGAGQGGIFNALYTVPAGQTSVTISLTGAVAFSSTYVCPADATTPKLQYAIKDIGSL